MNEKTKNYLGIAVIIGVLALAISALWYANTYSKMGDVNYARSFSVSGEGRVVAVPDIARFTFSIVTEGGRDLAALQESNVTKTNAAIDFLKQNGVDEKDIATEQFNVEPRYQNTYCGPRAPGVESSVTCPPPSIVGYTIRQTVAVKVRDLEKVGELLGGVVSAGANSTSNLQFTVDDPAQVEAEARAKAIAQAKEKAEAIAEAGGFKLGRLIMIEEGGYMPYYSYGKGGDMAMEAAVPTARVAAPNLEPGSQDVKINLTLRYEID